MCRNKCCFCCKWTVIAVISLAVFTSLAWFGLSFFYCVSPSCLMTTASLISAMNTSVDPCNDFYSHVCGRWASSDKSTGSFSQFSLRTLYNHNRMHYALISRSRSDAPRAVEQAKIFYRSCNNEDARNWKDLSPLDSLLQQLDLSRTPSVFLNNSFQPLVASQLGKMKKYLGSSLFVDTDVQVDPRNNKNYMLMFHAPFSNNTLRGWLKSEFKPSTSEKINRLVAEKNKIFKIAYIEQVVSIVLKEDYEIEIAERIYNLTEAHHKLNNNAVSLINELSSVTDKNYMSLQQFQNFTDNYVRSFNYVPKMDWKVYIEALLGNEKFNETSNLLIVNQDYLKKISLFMAETSLEDLELLIWWRVIEFSIPFLSEELRTVAKKYDVDLDSAQVQCVSMLHEYFGLAITRMIADESFTKEGKKKVEEMFEGIKNSFSSSMDQIDWIDAGTKVKIDLKMKNLKTRVGYPEWIFDDEALNQYYEGANMTPNNLLINVQRARTQIMKKELLKLFLGEQDEFLQTPTEVNAYYHPMSNTIEILDGILHFPFYDLGLEVLNYAAIGTVIGHEFIHAFDNIGKKYDEVGNLKNWWSNETTLRYEEKSRCFVEQYNNYEMPKNLSVNGTSTLGENIADNGGLKHNFNAYQQWKREHDPEKGLFLPGSYDLDQLFFIEFAHVWCGAYSNILLKAILLADVHSPSFVRVNNVLRNSEEFARIWKCPVGSKMNPEKKCKIW